MPRRKTPPDDSTPIGELWNMSETTAAWLEELGIPTYGALKGQDLHRVWLELKLRHRQVTKLMFYALWGAVHTCHWKQVPADEIERFESFRQSQA